MPAAKKPERQRAFTPTLHLPNQRSQETMLSHLDPHRFLRQASGSQQARVHFGQRSFGSGRISNRLLGINVATRQLQRRSPASSQRAPVAGNFPVASSQALLSNGHLLRPFDHNIRVRTDYQQFQAHSQSQSNSQQAAQQISHYNGRPESKHSVQSNSQVYGLPGGQQHIPSNSHQFPPSASLLHAPSNIRRYLSPVSQEYNYWDNQQLYRQEAQQRETVSYPTRPPYAEDTSIQESRPQLDEPYFVNPGGFHTEKESTPQLSHVDELVPRRPLLFPEMRAKVLLERQSAFDILKDGGDQAQHHTKNDYSSTGPSKGSGIVERKLPRKVERPAYHLPLGVPEVESSSGEENKNNKYDDRKEQIIEEDSKAGDGALQDAKIVQTANIPRKRQKNSMVAKSEPAKRIKLRITNKSACAAKAPTEKRSSTPRLCHRETPDVQNTSNRSFESFKEKWKRKPSPVAANDTARRSQKVEEAITKEFKRSMEPGDTALMGMPLEKILQNGLQLGDASLVGQMSVDIFLKIVSQEDDLWAEIEPMMEALGNQNEP